MNWMTRLVRIAGRWYHFACNPRRYHRFGFQLVPRIAGGAFQTLENELPAQAAAGATVETVIGVVPDNEAEQNWNIEKLTLVALAALNGVATNNVTFNFRAFTGGVARTIGTLQLVAGTNLAASQETVVPISAGASLVKGDVVTVQMVQNGTGLAVPAGLMAKAEID